MENYSKMDIVLYYIGKTYLALMITKMQLAFQEVIEDFLKVNMRNILKTDLGNKC